MVGSELVEHQQVDLIVVGMVMVHALVPFAKGRLPQSELKVGFGWLDLFDDGSILFEKG